MISGECFVMVATEVIRDTFVVWKRARPCPQLGCVARPHLADRRTIVCVCRGYEVRLDAEVIGSGIVVSG